MIMILQGVMLILVFSMALCFLRLLRGPSLADRIVALEQVAIHVVAMVAVYCILTEELVFLDAAVVVALLSFLSTVAFARYMEQGIER